MKIRLIHESENCKAELENRDGLMFLHCEVYKSSLSSIKLLKVLLKELREELGQDVPLFSYTQNSHFAKMLGGKFLTTFCIDSRQFEVWVWE